MSLSATLIAHNEGHRIARCLESLSWVDEIVVVVDDRTADDTAEVARRFTDRVLVRRFTGFADQRQWVDEQATGDWILALDCDERVTPELAAEIQKELVAPRHAAYRIPRLDYMFGRWVRYAGRFPQYQMRLYRRGATRWERIVHEKLVVDGTVGSLQHPLLHYSHLRLDQWVDKMARYTTLEAKDMYDQGQRMTLLRLVGEAPARFVYHYVVQQGFRDGMHGLAVSMLLAEYHLMRNLKLWDVQQQAAGPREAPEHPPDIRGPRA